jgi:opine dehydrogenase
MPLPVIAIVGAGNGGQASAAELGLKGYTIRLCDINPAMIAGVSARGGVKIEGVLEGFAPVELATTDLARAVTGADLIVIATARFAHAAIASNLAKIIPDNMPILLSPGSSGGALEFAKVLREAGKSSLISTLATLPYASRVQESGRVMVSMLAKTLYFASFPGNRTAEEAERWKKLYPALAPMDNELEVSLNNGNPITHPAPMLLNAARIENTKGDFFFYRDGTSPSVVRISECLDRERLELCRVLGFAEIPATERLFKVGYADKVYPTLLDTYQNSQAFYAIKAPESMDYRYVYEDIPYGSVFFASLGKQIGVSMPASRTIIDLAGLMTGHNFWEEGFTMAKLGLSGLTIDELLDFVRTGNSTKVPW